jgi:hypothetical protein
MSNLNILLLNKKFVSGIKNALLQAVQQYMYCSIFSALARLARMLHANKKFALCMRRMSPVLSCDGSQNLEHAQVGHDDEREVIGQPLPCRHVPPA